MEHRCKDGTWKAGKVINCAICKGDMKKPLPPFGVKVKW